MELKVETNVEVTLKMSSKEFAYLRESLRSVAYCVSISLKTIYMAGIMLEDMKKRVDESEMGHTISSDQISMSDGELESKWDEARRAAKEFNRNDNRA